MKARFFTWVLLSLILTIGTSISAQEETPSENRIQRYGHGFSEPNDFTPEEYEYIANNYSIFTVEKRHAWGDYGPKPNTEAATIGTAKKLKKINPDIKVLMYWNIVLNWKFYESQTEFNKHPEWVYDDWVFQFARADPVPMYDLNNPEVQEWWVNAIVDPVLRGDLDGVFLDASPKVPKEQYESLFKLIDEVRAKIGEDKIVIYNGFRVDSTVLQGGQDFIDHTSGVFIEFFFHKPLDTKEEAAFLFDNLIEAGKKGKMIIPRGSPRSVLPGTRDPFLFSFASFLLFHGPDSYYIYNAGYNKTQGMLEDHPVFDLVPGKPIGNVVRDGWVYTREFENITVTVDLEMKEAKIELHASKALNRGGLVASKNIEPNWKSMAANYKVPEWFVDGKIGIWSHWGPMSAVEGRPRVLWYNRHMYADLPESGDLTQGQTLTKWHRDNYGHPSEFGWEKFIPMFKAEKWDPDALVKFFKENGACFIMPVACHHNNFDMYNSSHPWNSVEMGPKRDIVGEWKDAAVKHGLKFGVSSHLYWSPGYWKEARKYQKEGTLEWKLFNMDYSPSGFSSQDSWNEHWYDRCWEIIEKYDPDMFNNDSPYPDEKRGKSLGVKLFSSYVNRDLKENDGEQTVVVSFKNMAMDKAAFTYNLERGMFGELQPYPWMWATDLSGSWSYHPEAVNRMSIPVLIANTVDVISKNGVAMLNIALRGDGTFPENQAATLKALGDWLKINGEGIYGTRPWITYGEGPTEIITSRIGENLEPYSPRDIRFTTKGDIIYAFVLAPPEGDVFIRKLCQKGLYTGTVVEITMLGSDEKMVWEHSRRGLLIKMPEKLPDQPVIGFKITSQ